MMSQQHLIFKSTLDKYLSVLFVFGAEWVPLQEPLAQCYTTAQQGVKGLLPGCN